MAGLSGMIQKNAAEVKTERTVTIIMNHIQLCQLIQRILLNISEVNSRVGAGSGLNVGNTERDESGNDQSETVTHEDPSCTLDDLDTGVEHLEDGHNASGNASLRGAEEEAEKD